MPYVSFDEDKSWWSQNVIIFSKHSPFMFLLKYSLNRGPLKKWTEHFTYSPNQILGWDFFAVSYSKSALICFVL